MKRNHNNSPGNDGSTLLDQNLSRLLKAAGDSSKPSGRFTQSLVDSVVGELQRTQTVRQNGVPWAFGPAWLEKSLGWAAVVGAACSAGLAVIASILLKMSFVMQAAAVLTVLFNWFTYFGEYIR